MKTFPHGTTIKKIERPFGKTKYLICTPGGDICQYSQDSYRAEELATIYEEYCHSHKR